MPTPQELLEKLGPVPAEQDTSPAGLLQRLDRPEPVALEVPPRVPFGAVPPDATGPTVPQLPATVSELGEQVTTLADPVLQGLTFGFGDELTAAAISATSDKTFDQALEDVRARSAEIRERLGTGFQVAEAGGAVTGGLGLTRLPGAVGAFFRPPVVARTAPQLARAVTQGAAVGTAAGATTGFATGEGLESRLERATEGAIGGATVGVVLPLVASGAAQALQGVVSRFSQGTANRRAAERLQRALRRDEITPQQAADELQSLGVDATVADIGGRNVRGLARATAGVPGRSADVAEDVLTRRQMGQTNRIAQTINRALGRQQTLRQSVDDLVAIRTRESTPLYQRAYGQTVEFTDDLSNLLKRDAVRRSWDRARRIASNEGIDLPEVFIRNADGTLSPNAQVVPDMRAWDYIKRGLDDIIETSRDPLTGRLVGEEARSFAVARSDLLKILDAAVPDYAAARAAFAGSSASIDALRQGRRLGRSIGRLGSEEFDPDQILKEVADMTDAEKAFFRQGLGQGLIDIIEATPDTADAVKRLVGTEARRGRLRAAFPDSDTFNRFMFDLGVEERFFNTQRDVLVGSRTTPLRQEIEDLASDFPTDEGFIANVLRGRPVAAVSALTQRARTPNERTLNALADLLFTPGAQGQANLRNALTTPPVPSALQTGLQAGLIEEASRQGR